MRRGFGDEGGVGKGFDGVGGVAGHEGDEHRAAAGLEAVPEEVEAPAVFGVGGRVEAGGGGAVVEEADDVALGFPEGGVVY